MRSSEGRAGDGSGWFLPGHITKSRNSALSAAHLAIISVERSINNSTQFVGNTVLWGLSSLNRSLGRS